MIPAVVNGVPFPLVRPSDGDVKNVVFNVQPYPVTINGFQAVIALPCSVLVDGSPTVAAVSALTTAILTIDHKPLVVVGSVLTLPSGHAGPVLLANGAGPAVNVS